MENCNSSVCIRKCSHHDRAELCTSRPPYRQGRKLTAVKVAHRRRIADLNEESQHLLIRGVPALKLQKELKNLCMRYGDVKFVNPVPQYAEDEETFTEVYHVLYEKIQSARFSKHMLDDRSFYGGILHVCYAPELETLAQTKYKLLQRKRDVLRRIRQPQPNQMISASANDDVITGTILSDADGQSNNREVSGQFTNATGVIEQQFVPYKKRNSTAYNVSSMYYSQRRAGQFTNTTCIIGPQCSPSVPLEMKNSPSPCTSKVGSVGENPAVHNSSNLSSELPCSSGSITQAVHATSRRKPAPDKFVPSSVKRIKFNKNP